jgi:hypothetical protein
MGRRLRRLTVGARFSEAHRKIWQAMEERDLSPQQAGELLGLRPGSETKLLYGDRGAGTQVADRARMVFGVAASWWKEPPRRPWEPPAARA